MKKTKIINSLVILVFTALVIFCIYNLFIALRAGNQAVEIITGKQYYTNSNLEAILKVKDSKKGLSVASKAKIELLKSDGKKVRGIKDTYEIAEGESANVNIKLPTNIETGSYIIKATVTSKFNKDIVEVPVAIINERDTNISISLDKGIYKPGDEINFRALITGKSTDKPENIDVNVYIYDGNNNRVYSDSTKTSDYGIVSGRFVLASEVNSGTYKLVISTKNKEVTKSFTVNPYIVPKFEASIITDKDSYIMGEEANITLKANYFFGEPVKEAEIKGTIITPDYLSSTMNTTKEKEFVGFTNSNGEFNINYKFELFGKVKIQAEIVDTSNYMIETNKTISVGTDVFEIDILPEHGDIIKGIYNEVYVITKKADGTPIKTTGRITIGDITRQVITDEFGIGKIVLSASDTANLAMVQDNIAVVLKDTDENEVTLKYTINITNNNGTAVTTDKIKYKVEDDIHISLKSAVNNTENIIYIFKNKELIKMISTDNENIDVNLGDVYGIIDIYVMAKSPYMYDYNSYVISDYYSYSNYNKKTIFIKPDKNLNIEIHSENEEYKPGDNLNISFTTKDKANNNIDSALMVSILDEAVLSLAENDLSIDNIKLALEDIVLTEGITGADLYANIIDNSSDTLLTGLLLKHVKTEPEVKYENYNNADKKSEARIKAIISAVAIAGLAILYSSVKSKRFGKVSVSIVNLIATIVVLAVFLYDFMNYNLSINGWVRFAILTILAWILYALLLYKFKELIFAGIVDLVFFPLIIVSILALIIDNTIGMYNVNEYIYILLLLIAPAILSLIVVIARAKKISKTLKVVKIICQKITAVEIMYVVTFIICNLLNALYDVKLPIIVLAILYIIYQKVILEKASGKKKTERTIKLDITGIEIIGIVALIGIVILGLYIYNSAQNSYRGMEESVQSMSSRDREYTDVLYGGEVWSNVAPGGVAKGDAGLAIGDGLSSIKRATNEIAPAKPMDNVQAEETRTLAIEENIRNVFLESLAFIPELITSNGKADATLKISDNITTWNIQTVGNTKEGNIGFASSSIKVFKEFFVDFELLKNSVVTDNISIPVTIYNYTENDLKLNLNIKQEEWFKLGSYPAEIMVSKKETRMIYVPIEVLKAGNNTLRVEVKSGNLSDIVEKTMEVRPNGLEKTKVVSSGTMENKISQDILFDNSLIIEGTENLKVKLYATGITQAIEGIENIFRMPTGCFEQTSSSLYPNILALRYLSDNKINNNELKEKALSYISSGYQRLLTFEVKGEKGGYSLYGNSPAVPVLTSYGLMELKDLSEVYDVDENVLNNMKEYLYKKQKVNGSFELGQDSHIGGAGSTDELSLNAYIIWALSESYPNDNRLAKSVKYLEDNIDKMKDTYTLALTANVFANTKNKLADSVVKKLMEKVQANGEYAYLTSNIRDYYGSYGTTQNIQTTALTSLALTKLNSNSKTNSALINYIISSKDRYGTWHSTQATILALKAVVEYSSGSDISDQDITVNVNGEEKKISINKNALDVYELNFTNVKKENNLSINMKKGKIYYEIIQTYYVNYGEELLKSSTPIIDVKQEIKKTAKVNEKITQHISVKNNSENKITNGMIEINIPQGFNVIEESLMQLTFNNLIEKYEYNYGKIYLYLKDLGKENVLDINIEYRANYPVKITGGSIRVYDYYNPEIEGICLPVNITVAE